MALKALLSKTSKRKTKSVEGRQLKNQICMRFLCLAEHFTSLLEDVPFHRHHQWTTGKDCRDRGDGELPTCPEQAQTTLTFSTKKVPQELLKGHGVLIAVAHLAEVEVGDDDISRIP